MLDYFYSQSFESRGQFCGKIQSVVVKHASCAHSCDYCGCVFGVFDLILWIGSDKEVSEWLPQSAIEVSSNKINFTLDQYYRCNVYVHQAKIQPADKNSTCSPQLLAICEGKCEATKVVNQTLSAIWNEVLVIENVRIFNIGGEKMFESYPKILFFLYDDADKKKAEYIGVTMLQVRIKSDEIGTADKNILTQLTSREGEIRKIFKKFVNQFPPFLRWKKFTKNALRTAEVLLSAELITLQAPTITIKEREINDSIPVEIYPEIRKFHLDVTFAGIRNASSLSHFIAGRYKIELSIGEMVMSSNFSNKSYKRNVNFMDPHVSAYLLLPEHFQFWPPIIIKHLDCSSKKSHVIGAAMIRRPEKFFIDQKPKIIQRFLLNDEGKREQAEIIEIDKDDDEENEKIPLLGGFTNFNQKETNIKRALTRCRLPKFLQFNSSKMNIDSIQLDCEYTWWTKYYNSKRDAEFRNGTLHELTIYNSELEKQAEFENFHDWAYPVELITGEKREKYATLKSSIKVSKCTGKEFFATEKLENVPSTFW